MQGGDDWVVLKRYEWSNVHLIIHKDTHIYNMLNDLTKDNSRIQKILILSKSVYDFRETNSLFICNMVTHKARKVLCEKVQVDATVRDSNL